MADFDYTTLTTDNSDSDTYTSVADVMQKNYNNLITIEKAKNSSTTINKYSATFNEPFIPKSGDNYTKPDKLDGTGYSWSTEQQKEVNKSEEKFQTQHIGADKYKADKAAEVAKRTSDQGNNTYLDNNKTTRDAFGREVEVGSGYDLHSGITPEDKSINSVASDPTLNNNAQRAIVADEKLKSDVKDAAKAEFAAKNLKLKNEILAAGEVEKAIEKGALNDRLQNDRIDTIANLSDSAAAKKQKADERAATEAAELAARQLAAAKREALVEEQKVEDEIADFEAQLVKDLKKDQQSRDRLEKIKIQTAKIEAENAINQAEAATRKKQAELDKIAEASDKSLIDDQQKIGLTTITPTQEDIDDGVTEQTASDVAIKSFETHEAVKTDEVLKVTASDEAVRNSLANSAEILKEREKERAIAAHDKFQNDRIDKIAEESDKAANENRYAFDPENAESYGEILAKGSEELQDALKSGEINNNSIGFNIAEQTAQAEVLAAEKAEKERLAELHNQQINSTTADDIADVKPSNAVAQQTEILAANLQDNKEKAVKVDKPSKSQIEKKYPPFKTLGNGDGSLHGKDPFRFTTLEYPTNITSDEQYGHFILFYVNVQNKTKYKYIGYNDDGNVKIVGDVVEKQTYTQSRIGADSGDYLGSVTTTTQPTSGDYTTRYYTEKNAGAEEVAYQKAQSYSLEGGGNILQSNQVTLMRQRPATQGIGSRMDLTSRITDSVALYLPSDIGNSTSTKYQGAELGMLGYLALGGADLLGQLQNRDFAGMGDTAVGMIDAAITEGLKKSAVTAADLFSGASTQGSIDKVFGQTVNPFIEVAFESMGVRSFEYTFNFTPKSKDETEEVKAIIQLFRFHMVPELKGTNHRYLTLPSTFDIHYMYQSSPEVTKENTYYNKIATCVLEDCNVSYTPTGVKSFDDGAPTQITMTLRFMETEMLTKEKVQQGF